MTAPWVVVSAELVEASGQGMANLALARHLVRRGTPVHVVAHRCDPGLARLVRFHPVPRPLRSAFLGDRLLARAGRWIARRVATTDPRTRVVVNGGNCDWGDVCWVHMVHHAWREPFTGVPPATRLRLEVAREVDRRRERRVIARSRVVIANSERTRRDLALHLGVDPGRVKVVYLGTDPGRFGPVRAQEREGARRSLGLPADAPVVVLVGGLGHDRKKGFDHVFDAWPAVTARRPSATLVVAGSVARRWRDEVGARLPGSVRLLGEVPDVERVLAAADLFVSPSRYDAYGMNVHEAVCRGVLCLVSRAAGVSERFAPDLTELVIPAPGEEPAGALAGRIVAALEPSTDLRRRFAALSERLRARTWDHVATDLVELVEETSPR